MIRRIVPLVATLAFAVFSAAQVPPPWQDDLVDHFAGAWKLVGMVGTNPSHHIVKAEWVFNHQFLEIHEKTAPDAPATESPYDAVWYLGYDDVSERYVMHLMDKFGGRFSETLGYGKRDGNELRFVFEYPDGPFHTLWRWHPDTHSWEWHMEQKVNGQWKTFGDFKLTPADR